jgi:hypothetical protein
VVFGGFLEGFPARINSATADRAAGQKPCRERKGVKNGGLLQKDFFERQWKMFSEETSLKLTGHML